MRKIYTLLICLLYFSFSKAQFPAPYCAEQYVSNVEPITYVKFDSIENNSSATVSGIEHEDFTNLSTTVKQGALYSITLKGNTDGTYTNYFTVFFDWNQDFDFDDADERYDIGSIFNSTGLDSIAISKSILVPATAIIGSTRMRVVKHYASYQTAPCLSGGFSHYGQAEDYTIVVDAGTNCSGTPNVTLATGPTSSCIDSLITVSVSGLSTTIGITFQWQSSNVGANSWTNISGATDATSTFAHNAANGQDYRCVVTCTASNLFSNSSKITVASVNCSAPINDDYCSAITLILDGASDCQNTKYATSNSDPNFICSAPNNTTWYSFTPSTTGNFEIRITPPNGGDTLNGRIGVFTASGSCPGSLTFTDVTTTVFGSCVEFGSSGLASETFAATLNSGTEYYFMIDGFFGDDGEYCISLKSPPSPPANCATNILPADMSIDVSAPVTLLKWSGVAGATNYDLYFGTTNPPTTRIGTTTLDSINVTGLAYNTTYYWYVVPKNTGGVPSGCDANTTSFTTIGPPPPPSNDECDSAIVLTNGFAVSGTTISATQTMPAQSCMGFNGTADDDVWYQFTASNNGDATITLTPINSFDAVIVVYSGTCGNLTAIGCVDSSGSTGSEILNLLNLNSGETYYFRVYSYSSLASGQGAFTVKVEGSALPVNLVEFKALRNNHTNLLNWKTAQELNNKGFEVQKSIDGITFKKIGFVESKAINGTSSNTLTYSFIDASEINTAYYKLKQLDKNGKYSFSKTLLVKAENSSKLIVSSVYPNPVSKQFIISISSPKQQVLNISIVDVLGKIVYKQNTTTVFGNNNINIGVEHLLKGNYILKLTDVSGNIISTQKIIKQ